MSGLTPPTPAMLRAYRQSLYSAGRVVAHVGSVPQGLSLAQRRTTLVMLGACNPCGRRCAEGSNNRMMDRLRLTLRRFRVVEGAGSLRQWSEAMLMVEIDPRRACVLARRFRQNAIIVIAGGRRTRLIVLTEKIPNLAD